MKILIVADWHGEIYAQAFLNGFRSLGHDSYQFSWKEYFYHYQYASYYKTDANKLRSFYYKIQNKFLMGPVLHKINNDLIERCHDIKPNLVFIYRGTHIYPKTIHIIQKKFGIKVFGYNNDDPFSDKYNIFDRRLWFLYKQSIPFYDWIFSYRWKNIEDYKTMGYDKVSLLRSYYLEDKNFHIETRMTNQYKCDVIFIGHFENDGRDETIKLLIDNNVDIKLYGAGWERSQYFNFFRKHFNDIKPLYDDYNLAINSAKIALVFLSKLNNDTYTRRCFEIPATKTMMLAEYTDDLSKNLFEEGKDAEYFRSKKELLKKVKYYLEDEARIEVIGNAGYARLIKDGHEVKDRVRQIVKIFESLNEASH